MASIIKKGKNSKLIRSPGTPALVKLPTVSDRAINDGFRRLERLINESVVADDSDSGITTDTKLKNAMDELVARIWMGC